MSLGFRTVWRAHTCALTASGLSLSPRELPRVLHHYQRSQLNRWQSTNSAEPKRHDTSTPVPNDHSVSQFRRVSPSLQNEERDEPEREQLSPSALRRLAIHRVIKKSRKRKIQNKNPALIKSRQWYPSRHEVVRSDRKSYLSKARQDLWAFQRAKDDNPGVDWLSTAHFLSKLTPKFGSIFDFKVIVGQGAADEIRKLLPRGPTAEPGRLQQSTRAVVRVDETDNADGNLHLTLTGSAHSVRMALMDLLKASGHITAVRLLDNDAQGMLRDLWHQEKTNLDSVTLLDRDEAGAGDQDDRSLTLTAKLSPSGYQWQKSRYYVLNRRADQIPKPAVWTMESLEKYIALLVYGVVPAHLHSSLYKKPTDHQQIVVSLLNEIFHSEQSHRSLSTEALAMTLAYIQSKGLTFRPTARAIFNQAEIRNIPMDTRICNIFVAGSVRTGDLDGFHNVLKLMARKSLHADSETWLSLLKIMEQPDAKHYILRKMRKLGLDRIQSTLVKAGQHMAPFELEKSLNNIHSITEFIEEQDAQHGAIWLDRITFNKLVDVLGKNGKHNMCLDLLDLIYESRRTSPGSDTLNTIITHSRSTQDILDVMRKLRTMWPAAVLSDRDTYDMLFQVAWKTRSPNMLRVIWHYATYARQASSKLRYRMNKLLSSEGPHDLGRHTLISPWKAVIAGETALPLFESSKKDQLGTSIARWNGAQSNVSRLSASLEDKLIEAYDMDRKIHATLKEGGIAKEDREKLVVDLPIMPRDPKRLSLWPPPPLLSSIST
ncbi:hypothetical protein PFICI_13084 [Pestalotiopsis fici W106-1]|uniref:Pentatricopeptide repeat domain-containing protein n=1 Tax=Pestalotiopsis fici (strain W106-1 / CGMCC3.15140) TaxID=1229662 RepID=W3WL01_PESFW|nr:uncharacterized protein PFICI_13084 [Pestalotiopsis fici W106-1]ETS74600.1 hypothetical protein PFICI_13084 [Pestalotiopsis fici W106-1]